MKIYTPVLLVLARQSLSAIVKIAIFDKIDFSVLKYPPEKLVKLKTCSTIGGTHVQTILNHKDLTGLAVGVW